MKSRIVGRRAVKCRCGAKLRAIPVPDAPRARALELRRTCSSCGRVLLYRSYVSAGLSWLEGEQAADVDGLSGCIQRRKARETGTVVGIYFAERAGLDTEAGPWATVCEEHGSICNHDRLSLARAHAANPLGWCEECRESADSRRK